MATDPYLLMPGEVRRSPRSMPALKATAEDTGGLVAVFEDTLAPRTAGPPLHAHSREDEALYVVEGEVLLQLGDSCHRLPAGAFAWIPRGTTHTFANGGEGPARLFGFATPAGIEGLFVEQGEYFAALCGAPQLDELARIGARYGSELLGAPITAPRG